MIEKNEDELEDNNTSNECVKLIIEKRKLLQNASTKVKEEVILCFDRLAKVLKKREKLLLRQIEAIQNQQLAIIQSNSEISPFVPCIKINFSEKRDIEEALLNFGKLSSSFYRNGIDAIDVEPYKIEDYIEANRDHVTLDKFIESDPKSADEADEETERFDDYTNGICDLSVDTSSDTDASSVNEITVLLNHDYCRTSDQFHDELVTTNSSSEPTSDDRLANEKIQNDKIPDDSMNGRSEIVARRSTRNTENCVEPKIIDGAASDDDASIQERYVSIAEKNFLAAAETECTTEINDGSNDILMKTTPHDVEEHPKQIKEWLQQILVETETEPTLHELEQFVEISKSRFKEHQFPLET